MFVAFKATMDCSMNASDSEPNVVQVAVGTVSVWTVLLGSVYFSVRIAVAAAVAEVQLTEALIR